MTTKSMEGIVLSRINFGEADRLLTVFTLEEGKIKVVARGSRKIKSKMAAHVEPFSIGKFYLVEGKKFYILAGAETTDQNEVFSKTIEIYKDASYICELLSMTLPEGVQNDALYGVTIDAFAKLDKDSAAIREIILRFFEYKLLESSGYVPNFKRCRKCDAELNEQEHYHGDFSGIFCSNCESQGLEVSKVTVKIFRLFSDNCLGDVLKIKGIENYNKELKEVILPFLYDILPRNPKAREI